MLDLDFGLQPMVITPFGYQARGFINGVRDFESGMKSINCCMATGTGKTILDGLLARWCIEEHGGRVLFLAHREELLEGCADDFAKVGIDVLVEQGAKNARWGLFDPKCVAASVQTMQGARMRRWPPDHFMMIITNECHHSTAVSYGNIYRYFNWRWHYGDTAGMDRLDGEDLGQVYQKVSFEYPYEEAVADKSIAPAHFVKCRTAADLSKIKTTAKGDLSAADVEKAITPHISELSKVARDEFAKAAKEDGIHRRVLGFAPDVGSAIAFASAFNSENINLPSVAVHADTQDRAQLWDDFRYGRYRVVWNYQVATEGTNLPFVSGSILSRATKSRNLYAQMVGRTVRKFPGKEFSLNIDFHWQSGEHELAGPTSMVDATRFNSDVLDMADAMIADGSSSDLMQAIERAGKVHKKRVAYKIKVDEAKARYRRVVYDPLSAMEVLGMPTRRSGEVSSGNRPPAWQVDQLAKYGVEGAEMMGKHRASRLLKIVRARAKQGLGSMKQVSWLIAKGVDADAARAMSKAEASARLDVLFNKARVG